MNIMPNGVGWILPPRCAARFTLGVLWKYGVEQLAYHDLNKDAKVDKVFMNIRNPYSRFRSWLRLWNTTLNPMLPADEYTYNLHWNTHGVQYTNKIENPNTADQPWKYIVPLSYYWTILEEMKLLDVTNYIRLEHLNEDMMDAGYPIQGEITPFAMKATSVNIGIRPRDPKSVWEPGDGQEDIDFYRNNPMCAEIVRVYYSDDFDLFGYSKDPEDIAL